jgi:hypothetical protein
MVVFGLFDVPLVEEAIEKNLNGYGVVVDAIARQTADSGSYSNEQ